MRQFLIVIFISFSTGAIAQNISNYIRWEGVSAEGHIIFGISYTKEEAQVVIDDFNDRNATTKYKIVYQTLRKRSTDNPDLVRGFYDAYSRKYRVLRKVDLASLHIFQVGNFNKAVDFLEQNSDRNKIEAQKHMHQLLKEYQLYRLEERKI